MNIKEKEKLMEALTVASEICGTEFSQQASKVIIKQLSNYDFNQVHSAIERCMNEISGRLTLAAIKQRIDDGRPSPEIAWSQCPMNEDTAAVLTEEQHQALCSVSKMLNDGDKIPARMAFIEKYKSLVAEARANGSPVKYQLTRSLTNRDADFDAVKEAVESGKLLKKTACWMLGHMRDDDVLALESPKEPPVMIDDKSEEMNLIGTGLAESMKMPI